MPHPSNKPIGTKKDIRGEIASLLPKLRAFARFLTGNVSEADDLVQEAVVRALKFEEQYIVDTNLKAWIFKILRNLFYEQLRRHGRERRVLGDLSNIPSNASSQAPEGGRERVMDLSVLLLKLPTILREALLLVGAQELSYEEAASVCGCSVGTMKARVSRARTKLAQLSKAI